MRKLYSIKPKKVGPQTSWIKTVLKSDKERVRRMQSLGGEQEYIAPREKLLFLEKMRSVGESTEEEPASGPGPAPKLVSADSVENSKQGSPLKPEDVASSRFPSPELLHRPSIRSPKNLLDSTFNRTFSPITNEGRSPGVFNTVSSANEGSFLQAH